MNSDRIKEIQETTAYPESVSVKQALLQVWNECEQEQVKNCNIPHVSGSFSLDFIKWYSGMEEQKILNAYERYKRENGNDR
jgi:hypothetical protein